jgi:hypothetical protein
MFGLSLMQVAVLVAYAYLMCCYLKRGDMKMKGLLTVAVVLFFCMGVGSEGFDIKSLTDTLKTDVKKVEDDIKGYQKASNIGNDRVVKGPADSRGGGKMGLPLPADSLNMSGYDGLCLKTGNQEYWMKSPDNTALVPNDTLYTYLGSEGPLKMRISDQAALTGPPVDGMKGSPEKMFMLANNVASPLCCPSTFSTSTGCICTTEAQRDYVAARGDNNDDYPTDSL